MSSLVGITGTPWEQPKGQWLFGGALAISLLLHAIIWAALTDRAERKMPETDQTPIMVDLVPPPEQEVPKQEAPEQEIKAPQPEQQPKPEEQAARQPVPTFQPVIEYGETDGGSKIAPDGTSAQDQPQPDEPEKPDPGTDTAENQHAEAEPSEGSEDEAVETATAPDQPEIPETETEVEPQSETDAEKETEIEAQTDAEAETESTSAPEAEQKPEPEDVAGAEAAPDADTSESDTAGQVAILVTPKARPAPPARKRTTRTRVATSRSKAGPRGSLKRATRLYSREILSDPSAQASLIGVSRSVRINRLCGTEMRAQILAQRPSRAPDYLPSFPRASGTVLQRSQAAFFSRGQWYDIAFHCEVDRAASRVENFSFRLGGAVPPADWARRKFPKY